MDRIRTATKTIIACATIAAVAVPVQADLVYLTVPRGVPIEQYWSVTAYDRQTHALIKNVARASRSSQIPELQKNSDGSEAAG